MLTLEQAQAEIRKGIISTNDSENIDLGQCPGRFVAQAITAQVDNPAFANSAMDGYAVCMQDLIDNQYKLPLRGESRCGITQQPVLEPGSTMRIFTGAPLPEGADTVVMQEDISVDGDSIAFPEGKKLGQNIRAQGEDFTKGEALFDPGHRLNVFDIALLATAGIAKATVFRQPRALVMATGDELVAPGESLQFGQIFESNRQATVLLLQQLGVDVDDGGTVGDTVTDLQTALSNAEDYDFIITSGGVSVGDHDFVKQVFADLGEIQFWKARIKPGKPVAFGRLGARSHFFALPGNPVSSLVTFKLFVEPAIYAWHQSAYQPVLLPATAVNDFQRRSGRMEFLRARMFNQDNELRVEMLSGQGSHMLKPISQTNCFIKLAEDSSGFAAGSEVTVWPLV